MKRARTAVAVVLAVVHPGLGHLYLREWGRALLWAGVFVTVVAVTLPPAPESMGPVEATVASTRRASPTATLGLSALVVANALDAGVLARRDRSEPDSEDPGTDRRCPNCGKELDEDIDFCHWCTVRLDDPETKNRNRD